jgi:hypothetical protein
VDCWHIGLHKCQVCVIMNFSCFLDDIFTSILSENPDSFVGVHFVTCTVLITKKSVFVVKCMNFIRNTTMLSQTLPPRTLHTNYSNMCLIRRKVTQSSSLHIPENCHGQVYSKITCNRCTTKGKLTTKQNYLKTTIFTA